MMKYCLADQYAFGNFPLNETEKLSTESNKTSFFIYFYLFYVYLRCV